MPSYNNASRRAKVEDLLTEAYLGRKYYTDHQKLTVLTYLKSPTKMMELMKKIYNDPVMYRRYLEASGTQNTTRRSKPVPPMPTRSRAAEYMPNMRPKAQAPKPNSNSNTRSKAKAPAYNSNTHSKAQSPKSAYNSNTHSKAQSPKSAYNSNANSNTRSNKNSNIPLNMSQNHYKILGLTQDASPKNIKKAYHKLALEHHPDKGGNANMFKKIGSAYNVLKNAATRKAYNAARD